MAAPAKKTTTRKPRKRTITITIDEPITQTEYADLCNAFWAICKAARFGGHVWTDDKARDLPQSLMEKYVQEHKWDIA